MCVCVGGQTWKKMISQCGEIVKETVQVLSKDQKIALFREIVVDKKEEERINRG